MAINEQDREDLLRDGRAMTLRGEMTIGDTVVVVGFRAGTQMSVYVGADPVYQFNADHQVRRVFYDRQRYAADHGRLLHLQRDTKGGRVQFSPVPITVALEQTILADLQQWLVAIGQTLDTGRDSWKVAGDNAEAFFSALGAALQTLSGTPSIAKQPNQ